ncbi:MAG: succinylglutamate desuccinylase/aspartoacylase family protein [Kofleriaceae bacterium]
MVPDVSLHVRSGVRPEAVPVELDDFLDGLDGPTVFAVDGHDPSRVRVVSGTLHGDEPSGVRAIHRMLREGRRPVTDVLMFVGAVDAARQPPRLSHRFLPGRRDLNRCFRPPWDGLDGTIAQAALAALTARTPELAVDLHNNTGRNPSYAIGSILSGPHLALTALFTHRFIHSEIVLGTMTEAMNQHCPSITVECGQARDPEADETAWLGLVRLFELPRLDPVVVTAETLMIFSSPERVELTANTTLAFGATPVAGVDLTLDPEIDRHNFQTLSPGTRIGTLRPGAAWPIVVRGACGVDRSRELFELDDNGDLVTREAVVPIMMTTSPAAAISDCLFYAVHRQQ